MSAATVADRLRDHGIDLRHDHEGTQRTGCPACDRGTRDTALAVTVDYDGTAVWFCHRCGFKGAVRNGSESVVRPTEKAHSTRHDSMRHESLSDRWRAFWRECGRIKSGCFAAIYLQSRGCALPPVEGHLRWHSDCWHWPTQSKRPAMVGLITDAVTCTPLSLHFTFLRLDGSRKAGTGRDKLMLARHRKSGGVIRLWPDDCVAHGLLIAEGIETALTAARGYTPAWCSIDGGNLEAFPVLNGVESLVICVDNDAAGHKAANTCARRWLKAGREVVQFMPGRVGEDVNDWAGAT